MSKELLSKNLFFDIKSLIQTSKEQVAVAVNSSMSILYWQIGKRVNSEVLKNTRAKYGKRVVASLAKELTMEYGRGWGERHLRNCLRFAESFSDFKIVNTLCSQLSWSHIRLVFPMEDKLKREFYIQMCIMERWSVRTFTERINSMLYERTAISKKPDKTIMLDLEKLGSSGKISTDLVFRDPYFLDFLGLGDKYSEKDLESSILVELQKVIIEFGTDFAFLARQKRVTIDDDDYYMDLLFYHRRLKSLVVIELKLGKFKAEHKGQMELYLRWLEKYEMQEGENLPIGLILCATKNEEHIELLNLEKSNIKVAQYLTKLPEFTQLGRKLHESIKRVQNRFKN